MGPMTNISAGWCGPQQRQHLLRLGKLDRRWRPVQLRDALQGFFNFALAYKEWQKSGYQSASNPQNRLAAWISIQPGAEMLYVQPLGFLRRRL